MVIVKDPDFSKSMRLKMTREEFEAAYVMWKSGPSSAELSRAFGVSYSNLRFCLILRDTGDLEKYTVHFKDSN